jgi:hypothetical protein
MRPQHIGLETDSGSLLCNQTMGSRFGGLQVQMRLPCPCWPSIRESPERQTIKNRGSIDKPQPEQQKALKSLKPQARKHSNLKNFLDL